MDLDYANPTRFPPHDTARIAVLRVRDNRTSRDDLDRVVSRPIHALRGSDPTGHVWIVERVRQYEEPADDNESG